jgi:hypothetical protein
MTPDLGKLAEQQADIAKAIERNKDTLRNARSKEQRYTETLKRSDTEARSARRALRRAGYLKSP